MTLPRKLPALLLLAGVLSSVLAMVHHLNVERAHQADQLRAQVNLAANLAVDRLRNPVLLDNAELARTILDELLSPSPANAAVVVGLDGTVLASWQRVPDPQSSEVNLERFANRPWYPIRTGRRPIGQLTVDIQKSDVSLNPSQLLIPGGLPLLVGLLGFLALGRGRLGPVNSGDGARVDDLEAELVEARSALESASRTKSLFLANMSHEIRTPLNGVLGMADLLLGTPLDDRQRKFANTVRGSAESLLNIVNDLLDFSRVESGSLHLDRLDFCPRECVEDVVQLLGVQAHAKGIELVCEVAEDLPRMVRGDPARLRQILVNLIGNAVKFTEKGEVVVRVRATLDENRSASFHIEVADTGIGIPDELQSRIFDSFVQLDASTTRRYGGAGLGLAISRHLVELMDGQITLKSELGVGTTFTVTLLLEAISDAASNGVNPAAALRGTRVLIVDDNDTNRLVLSNQLESWNIKYEAFSNGWEALAAMRSAADAGTPFSVAILDMQMPQMDGITLAGHIKSDRRLQDVRLMLLTSAVLELSPDELREAGFAQFTCKPVRQSQLYNCLLQLASNASEREKETVDSNVPDEQLVVTRFQARVLLVEDNAINQEVARHMLESLGCEVEVAENGRSALDKLDSVRVDLVLMDCQMPVMDGFETTEALRERERAAEVASPCPIIALTANALAGDREQCLAAGMDDYVSKPFNMEELERVLTRWLPSGGEKDSGSGKSDSRFIHEQHVETSADVLDGTRLDFIRSMQRPGTPDLVAKVVRLFLDRAPELIESIAEAVAEGDPRALQSAAHSLKSSSANLGAVQVAEIARELERFGREGDLTQADEMVTLLRSKYPLVQVGLERHLPATTDVRQSGVHG